MNSFSEIIVYQSNLESWVSGLSAIVIGTAVCQKKLESWVSGLNQQFAKLSYGSNRTGGSNPPLSALLTLNPFKDLGLFFSVFQSLDFKCFFNDSKPSIKSAAFSFFVAASIAERISKCSISETLLPLFPAIPQT